MNLLHCRLGITSFALASMLITAPPPALDAQAAPTGPAASQAIPLPLPPDAMRPAIAQSLPPPVAGAPIVLGRLKPGQAPRMVEGTQTEYLICTPYISWDVIPRPFGPQTVKVDFMAELICNFYLSGNGQANLLDMGTGRTLAIGEPFQFASNYYGYSYGAAIVDGRIESHGRWVQVSFGLRLQTLDGVIWGGCYGLPDGMIYLSPCDGLGTTALTVTVGTEWFPTTLPPFNPAMVIRNTPTITLLTYHLSGSDDLQSTAASNIISTAYGLPAYTSDYSDVGTTEVYLHVDMLTAMVKLNIWNGYSYQVTTIAGGDHAENSRHYYGRAFDVDVIGNREVDITHPLLNEFMAFCLEYGATQVIGPPDAKHPTSIHCAW